MSPIAEIIVSVLLVAGALQSLTAAIGLLRLPGILSRIHAATKPQVLGMFLFLAATGLQASSWGVVPVLVVAWIFQVLTVPVSGHMVASAAYRAHGPSDQWSRDDFSTALEALQREQEAVQERPGERE